MDLNQLRLQRSINQLNTRLESLEGEIEVLRAELRQGGALPPRPAVAAPSLDDSQRATTQFTAPSNAPPFAQGDPLEGPPAETAETNYIDLDSARAVDDDGSVEFVDVTDALEVTQRPTDAPGSPAIAAAQPIALPPPLPVAAFRPTPLPAASGPEPAMDTGGRSIDGLPAHPASTAERPQEFQSSFEAAVGGKVYAIVGAIAVVIGIGLFIKWGVDQGWFAVSPVARCILAAMAGFALIGGGEVARRRISAWASTGLYSAGLGVLFMTTYGAHALYRLMPVSASFVLLGLTAMAGILIATLARLPVVAVVALVGGFGAPVLFDSPANAPLILPAYLLTLLTIGLVLTARQGGAFALVRSAARIGTLLLGGLWVLQVGRTHLEVAVAFAAAVWAAVHLELIYSSRVNKLEGPPIDLRRDNLWVTWPAIAPLAASLTVTLWTCLCGIYLSNHDSAFPDWLFPAALLVVTLPIGLALCRRNISSLLRPRTGRTRLASVLMVQAGALVLVTFALAVGGWAQVTGWLILAVACFVAGRWLRSSLFFYYGLAPLIFGTVRLIAHDVVQPDLIYPAYELAGLRLSNWTFLMAVCSAVWFASAVLLASSLRAGWLSKAWLTCVEVMTIVGCVVLGGSLTHNKISLATFSAVWFGVMALTAALSVPMRSKAVYVSSLIMAVPALLTFLACGWWHTEYVSADWFLIISRRGLVGVFGAAALTFSAWCACVALRSDRKFNKWIALLPMATASALLLAALSHENVTLQALLTLWVAVTCGWAAATWSAERSGWAAQQLDPAPGGSVGNNTDADDARYAGDPAILHRWKRRFSDALLVGLVVAGAITTVWWARGYLSESWGLAATIFGILLAVCVYIAARAMQARATDALSAQAIRATSLTLISVMLFYSSTRQVASWAWDIFDDRQSAAAAVSIWWGVCAIGLLIRGFRKQVAPLRHVGLALLATAAVKGLIVDMSGVQTGWRIISFIALGAMMMSVAIIYQRAARLTLAPSPANPQPGAGSS